MSSSLLKLTSDVGIFPVSPVVADTCARERKDPADLWYVRTILWM